MKKRVLMMLLLVFLCGGVAAYADPAGDLLGAARNGDTAQVTALLSSGADINSRDEHEMTALMQAVRYGKSTVVNLLLAKGAKIDLQNDHGDTALIMAAQANSAEMVKLLLERGADVNIKGEGSPGALGMAAFVGNVEMFNLVLAKGPKEVSYPYLLQQAECGAAFPGDKGENGLDLARMLSSKVDFAKLSMDEKNRILCFAAGAGDLALVQRLFDIKQDNVVLANAFVSAAFNDRFDVLKYFLAQGVKVDIANSGFTYSETNYGISFNIKAATAFAITAAKGKAETVIFLVLNGAKVDQRISGSYCPEGGDEIEIADGTALIFAACKGDSQMVKLLLDAGADPKVKTKDGKTALDFAKLSGSKDVVEMLQKR